MENSVSPVLKPLKVSSHFQYQEVFLNAKLAVSGNTGVGDIRVLYRVPGSSFILESLSLPWPYELDQKIKYDQHLPNSGLLIWHIDEDVGSNSNEWHRRVDLEQADGLFELNYKKQPPKFPSRIGVVTSLDGSVITSKNPCVFFKCSA